MPRRTTSQPRAQKRMVTKEQAQQFMAKVPDECAFWCCDGSVFRDMSDMAEGLAAMSDETYRYHRNTEKRDFTNWVNNVLGDQELADELLAATGRMEAARCASDRVTLLVHV